MSTEQIILTCIVPLITGFLGYLLGISRDKNKTVFDKKLEIYSGIVAELSKNRYLKREVSSHELLSLFSPARLLASASLEKKLRNYFSNVSDYWKKEDLEQLKLVSVISEDYMEIEQLMREELNPGDAGRIYPTHQLKNHIKEEVTKPVKSLIDETGQQ